MIHLVSRFQFLLITFQQYSWDPQSSCMSSFKVDLTSYIMMLKSAQFSPLKHIIDFARVVRSATDRKLASRSHTPNNCEHEYGIALNTKDEHFQHEISAVCYLIAPLWSLTLKDCFSCHSSSSSPSKDSLFTEKALVRTHLHIFERFKLFKSACSSVLVWDSYKYSPGEPLQ